MNVLPLNEIFVTNKTEIFSPITDKAARPGPGVAIIAIFIPVRGMLRPCLRRGEVDRLVPFATQRHRQLLLGIVFTHLLGGGEAGHAVKDRRQDLVAANGITSTGKETE